jgi:hypothetical protein
LDESAVLLELDGDAVFALLALGAGALCCALMLCCSVCANGTAGAGEFVDWRAAAALPAAAPETGSRKEKNDM